MQAHPPNSIQLIEGVDARTIYLPIRMSALALHVARYFLLGGMLLVWVVWLGLLLQGVPTPGIVLGVLAWGSGMIWGILSRRHRPILRITAQRLTVAGQELLLEEATAVVLDLDRERLRIEALGGQVLVLPSALHYAEMVWLRTVLEDAIQQRRNALGTDAPQQREVPEGLAHLRVQK